jgi:hypothetical protein
MTKLLQTLFRAKHLINPGNVAALGATEISELRAVAQGSRFPDRRTRALDVLSLARPKDVYSLFETIIKNPEEESHIRAIVAAHLSVAGGQEAEQVLIEVLVPDEVPVVLAQIIISLSKIGTKASIFTLELIATDGPRSVRSKARFAASVIAARECVAGFRIRPPRIPEIECHRQVSVQPRLQRISARLAKHIASVLGPDSYSLSLQPESGYEIRCYDSNFGLLFDKQYTGSNIFNLPLERPCLLGVVAESSPLDASYSATRVVLAWPNKSGKVNISLHRTDGKIREFGTAEREGNQVKFNLQSVRPTGKIILSIEGTERGGINNLVVRAEETQSGKWLATELKRSPTTP